MGNHYADYDLEVARRAAKRINKLTGKTIAEPVQVDVADLGALERVLTGIDAFLSAIPCYYNLDITQVAIRVGAHMCDLGGHIGLARQQHAFDGEARAAGISLIPNCGQVPARPFVEELRRRGINVTEQVIQVASLA